MADSAHKQREAEQVVKHHRDRISLIEKAVAELETRVAEQKQQANEAVRKAEEVCPRIVTERSRKSIKSEINKLERCIERELPQREEQERIEKEYLLAMKRYERTQQIIRDENAGLNVRYTLCLYVQVCQGGVHLLETEAQFEMPQRQIQEPPGEDYLADPGLLLHLPAAAGLHRGHPVQPPHAEVGD